MSGVTLLIAGALLQGLSASAEAERTAVAAGEEVEVTLTVRTRGDRAPEVPDPALVGAVVIDRRELSEVEFRGAVVPFRTTVITFVVRATSAGRAAVGPFLVRHGGETLEVPAVMLDVRPSATAAAVALSPVAARLLARAPPPPRADEVSLTAVASGETVHVGEQLDVLVAAWFPRGLRQRLRRPPALLAAPPDGVWQYPQEVPPGVVASRLVHGVWMDVYAAHLVLFPLRPGQLEVQAPRVEYAVPLTSSFFSREERFAVAGRPLRVTALPVPAAGRHPRDLGAVGRNLLLAATVTPGAGRVGEPIEATIILRGEGNVALWPPPTVAWPPGFRVYAGETSVALAPSGGRVTGMKRFAFLLVPDSAGAWVMPAVEYPFFDVGSGVHRVARVPPRRIAVAPTAAAGASRAAPPLAAARGPGLAADITERWAGWPIAVLVAVGPLAAALRRWRPRLRWRWRRRRGEGEREQLETEFVQMLVARVGTGLAERGRLVAALRASGVETALAEHVGRLRERLQAARYAPAAAGDASELTAELVDVMRLLAGDGGGRSRRRAAGGSVMVLLLLGAGQGAAQRAEALYDLGALRAAADSFAARAARDPLEPMHWYNLGATVYRAGADGRAVAAWTVAARLAPRNPLLQRGRVYLPPTDPATAELLRAAPMTSRELWLAAAILWTAGWLAFALRVRRRAFPIGLIAAAVVAVGFGAAVHRRYARPLAVVTDLSPLREAPYGTAPASATLPVGAAVRLERRENGWVLASRPGGGRGWLLEREIVELPRVQ